MGEHKRRAVVRKINPEQAERLGRNLKAMVAFIETHIPADVIATKQKHGLNNARLAARLEPKLDVSNAREAAALEPLLARQAGSLIWCMTFITDNYKGDGTPELADAALLLVGLGFMQMVEDTGAVH